MAGTTATLSDTKKVVDTSYDGTTIPRCFETIPGGRSLDTTGFTAEVIQAGHLIIEETATGVLKPMPVSGTAYGTLPASHTYKGILVASILTAKPLAAIMVRGTINEESFKNATGFVTPGAAKTQLTLIRFVKD